MKIPRSIAMGVTLLSVLFSCKPQETQIIPVSSISVNPTSLTLEEGETSNISATVSPSNATDKTVTWSSSSNAVATIKDGVVTAVKEGSATITAKAGGKTAVCEVKVNAKFVAVTSITLDQTSLDLKEGETATLTATVKPDNATDKAVAWTSSNDAVATVKELGISSYTLYDWKSKAEGQKYPRRQGPLSGKARKRYTPEFKTEVIAYYQSHGARETLQKYGIVNNSLYNWVNEAGVEHIGSNHANAIALYLEKGPDAVLEEYGIAKSTLKDWLKEAGIHLNSPKYSAEFKAAAVAMTEEKPLTTVAKELGIPASTLATWTTKNR